jgi:hypothetical protein
VSYGLFKNDEINGYGNQIFPDGSIYRGEFINSCRMGYGNFKDAKKDEYEGSWSGHTKDGEKVFKEASTGRIERRLYDELGLD